MKLRPFLLSTALVLTLISCRKDHVNQDPPVSSGKVERKVLLKNIEIPRLPSPYYHFEYGADSLVTKADFASGNFMYDVLYSNGRIGEMRNNIFVNHDTLRYVYGNSGEVLMVNFIDQHNTLNRHVLFTYHDAKVAQIDWEHATDGKFTLDRTLSFTYHPDGNLKEMTDHRPAISGAAEINFTTHYDDYDDKINVDDFTLIHDGIHDHLLILPGLDLQKNNHRKEWVTGIENQYTVDYKFTYNSDDTPIMKSGEFVFTSGNQSGQKFEVSTSYSYY